ncbi:molybdopterin-binding protein [Bartonella sp. G70]|uniref:Molybdopterin-binding protein n=1 Tax=Bartonella bilalgolemii TaxID=2942911 RepID=A0ABT0P8K7_9HYPH|nr:molybdopterin-binding protein [Bartonella sp. G70]
MGGLATTHQIAKAVLNYLVNPISVCHAAIITVGDELLSGQYLNTNLQNLSQSLERKNIQVTRHFVCADQLQQISKTVISCLRQEDLIIISGGLGPTSDDKTRDAIAQAVKKPLVHHENVWQKIKGQLQQLDIVPDTIMHVKLCFLKQQKCLIILLEQHLVFTFPVIEVLLLFCLVRLHKLLCF